MFFLSLLLIINLFLQIKCNEYGIMIDAGSSGSRLYVYSWNDRIYKNLPPSISIPVTQESWSRHVTPALSSFADDKSGLNGYISSLISFGVGVLKNYAVDYSNVPIYLYATAGLRILSRKKRDGLIQYTRDIFNNKTVNPFYFEDSYCRIISGEEEGVYGWISVNQIMGTFGTNKTYGALDLGGASTQITFYNPDINLLENSYAVPFLDVNSNLYTHSFLHYGLREFNVTFYEYIISINTSISEVSNPCLPSSFKGIYHSLNNNQYTIYGNSNPDLCNEYIIYLLGLNDTCISQSRSDEYSCSIHGTYQCSCENIIFYGYSQLSYIPEILNITNTNPTLKEVYDFANEICSLNYDDLQAKFPDGGLDITHYCYRLQYMYSLLAKAYKIPENEERVIFAV